MLAAANNKISIWVYLGINPFSCSLDITIVNMNSAMIRLEFCRVEGSHRLYGVSNSTSHWYCALWHDTSMWIVLRLDMIALCFQTISVIIFDNSNKFHKDIPSNHIINLLKRKKNEWKVTRFYPMPLYCRVFTLMKIPESSSCCLRWYSWREPFV